MTYKREFEERGLNVIRTWYKVLLMDEVLINKMEKHYKDERNIAEKIGISAQLNWLHIRGLKDPGPSCTFWRENVVITPRIGFNLCSGNLGY